MRGGRQQLERSNSFLIALDNRREWYRYVTSRAMMAVAANRDRPFWSSGFRGQIVNDVAVISGERVDEFVGVVSAAQ